MVHTSLLTTVVLLGLASSIPAHAQGTQAFELVFNQGPLAGQSFPGQFEVSSGDGIKYPDDGSLLNFSATVDGVSFTDWDDVDFPDFPEIDVIGDQVVYVDAFFEVPGPNIGSILSISVEKGVGNSIAYFSDSNEASFGFFRFPGVPVPDASSTAVLFGLGMGGLAWARRRQRA